MMHRNRVWQVNSRPRTLEEIATAICEDGGSWTACTAWDLGDGRHVLVNDATCEDGAGEWGPLLKQSDGSWRQVESITFSWCPYAKALEYLREIVAGSYDDGAYGSIHASRIQTHEQHQTCGACA